MTKEIGKLIKKQADWERAIRHSELDEDKPRLLMLINKKQKKDE